MSRFSYKHSYSQKREDTQKTQKMSKGYKKFLERINTPNLSKLKHIKKTEQIDTLSAELFLIANTLGTISTREYSPQTEKVKQMDISLINFSMKKQMANLIKKLHGKYILDGELCPYLFSSRHSFKTNPEPRMVYFDIYNLMRLLHYSNGVAQLYFSDKVHIYVPGSDYSNIINIKRYIQTHMLRNEDIKMESKQMHNSIDVDYGQFIVHFMDKENAHQLAEYLFAQSAINMLGICFSEKYLYYSVGSDKCAINADFFSKPFKLTELFQQLETVHKCKLGEIQNLHGMPYFSCGICLEEIKFAQGVIQGLIDIDCGHSFHSECIRNWTTYRTGDIVTPLKYKCPMCRSGDIPHEYIRDRINFTQLDFTTKRYKICECRDVFEVRMTGCAADDTSESTRCDRCMDAQKTFSCPNCKLELSRHSGCRLFRCCLYGRDGCRGESCTHGSTDFVKFCGHAWVLPEEDTPVREIRHIPFGILQSLYMYDSLYPHRLRQMVGRYTNL